MKKVVTSECGSGERIDKFLKEEFFLDSEVTRGDIIRNIKEGRILINGKKVKPSYILKDEDEISLDIQKEEERLIPNKDIEIKIVYQNDDFIIVNKTAGIQVHPSDSEKENALINRIVTDFPEIVDVNDGSKYSWMRPGIVHRLDKDTSGIMVMAKNQKTFDELKKKFADREVKKSYIALVHGNLEKEKGIIDEPIARAANFKKQKIATGRTKGAARSAVTEYALMKSYEGFDLIEVFPKTGRMHQIRVHMAFLGNPIVGDLKYRRRNISPIAGAKRQLLHAQKLQFELRGKNYEFSADLPDDFADFLLALDEKKI